MSEMIDQFRSVDETALRVIAMLDSKGYRIAFIRDGLLSGYDEADLQNMHFDLLSNLISVDDFKNMSQLGGLDCQLFLFEAAVVFIFPSTRYSCLYISYDRTDPFPMMKVVEAAKQVPHVVNSGSA